MKEKLLMSKTSTALRLFKIAAMGAENDKKAITEPRHDERRLSNESIHRQELDPTQQYRIV